VLKIDIPGRRSLRLIHVVLDVNGTLAVDGRLVDGVAEVVRDVGSRLAISLLSADTHGRLDEIARTLDVPATRLRPGGDEAEQKARFVQRLGAASVAAIGNGANDVGMLRASALSIAVLGGERLATELLSEADVLVASPVAALGLLSHPRRLVATLRR
jgi:P-type E1-E2 ATPase